MVENPHPDRLATTFAERSRSLSGATVQSAPTRIEDDTGDARVDLQLLRHATERALARFGTDAAREWATGLDSTDFRRGTIQDGTARGVMARLEETISLCDLPTDERTESNDAARTIEETLDAAPLTGKALRRKREILIASGGARIRFSRKLGMQLVDRSSDLNEPDCVQFEDQADAGCLDGFAANPATRARLFSPAFLAPTELVQNRVEDRLELAGRLGRRPNGFACRITLVGRKDEPGIRMTVRIDNRSLDHRLRIRFRGLRDQTFLSHRGTPGICSVQHNGRTFVAATLVRACGRLRVGDRFVDTPGAQVQGWVEHTFGLGLEV